MRNYETSTATLQAILAHPSLQREKIDETMEALAEANASAREVDDIIRVGGDVALGIDGAVDEDELEEEWKAMVNELQIEEIGKKLDEANNVPDHIIAPTEISPDPVKVALPAM